jgi:hypothetical protein
MLKILKWTGLAVAVIVGVGVPSMVGVRPFVGPRARPVTDRRFEANLFWG